MSRKLHISFLLMLFVSITASAQTTWTNIVETDVLKFAPGRVIIPDKYKVFQLDAGLLQTSLANMPVEFSDAALNGTANILLIPMPDGGQQRFRVSKSPVMEPGLQAKFPEIRTFGGQGIDDPYATIKIDWNPYTGFHAQILSVNNTVYIDPYAQGNTGQYISYLKTDLKDNEPSYREGKPLEDDWYRNYIQNRNATGRLQAATPCRGTNLLTYRLAVACTGEYARAATSNTNPSVAQTMAMITTTINRVDGVYERELSVRLVLIADNNLLVYTDPATDAFAGNDDAGVLIDESQRVIDSTIGNANYDIGHTFSTGGGGLAGLGVICRAGQKASGITGRGFPVGDPYDIDYVCHEVGHQFGANHTFNGADPTNCAPNANPGPAALGGTAYEVGSGTTIMGYAGICLLEDIQPNSDPFFHTVSFDEIGNYITTGMGGSCPVNTPTGNLPPTILSMNNNGITVPVNTPFKLTATASDPNGDAITYDWEQWDLGGLNTWNGGALTLLDPLFKSRLPKTTGTRMFPDIRVILAGFPLMPAVAMDGLKGETLPLVPRQIKFRLTVRDNRNGGGGVVTGGEGCAPGFTGTYSITAAGLPFTMSAPNGAETWACGSQQTVTWNVNATNLPPVSSGFMNIKLSIDGGLTYPITLATNTPNDGSQVITVPSLTTTTTARVMVESADNIFFDISNANFTAGCSVLPLTMGSFTAKAISGNNALLSWNTLSEYNNKAFEIQRSIGDASAFTTIGRVNGKGDNPAGHSYVFTDGYVLPYNTAIYYRLRQLSVNDQETFSEVRNITFGKALMGLQVWPNPVKDVVTIYNPGQAMKAANIQIFSVDGKLLFAKKAALLATPVQLNIGMLPTGIYQLKIADEKSSFTQKLLKE